MARQDLSSFLDSIRRLCGQISNEHSPDRNSDEFYARKLTLSPETVDAIIVNFLSSTRHAYDNDDTRQLLGDLQELGQNLSAMVRFCFGWTECMWSRLLCTRSLHVQSHVKVRTINDIKISNL
jgi:hypothetical protein